MDVPWHRIAALAALTACGRSGFVLDDEQAPDPCEARPSECVSHQILERQIDVLFVVDDSGSMADAQAKLARNFERFVQVLERDEASVSLRVAVVGTSRTTPRARSCIGRPDDFRTLSTIDESLVDAFAEACADVCTLGDFELDQPWIETDRWGLPQMRDATLAEVFACVAPQGIGASGLEQPMLVLAEFLRLHDPQIEFRRPGAPLAVVIITDEVDCSANDFYTLQLLGDDPHRPGAGCWAAGMACTGGPGVYDECHLVDVLNDEDEPVLFPVSWVVADLQGYQQDRAEAGANPELFVSVIAGVPSGFPENPLVFRDAADPEVNAHWGIGPGCGQGETLDDPIGLPPLRLVELTRHFPPDGDDVFSVCEEDYSAALESIAAAIVHAPPRVCVPGCVTDDNPAAAGLQPDCDVATVVADDPDQPSRTAIPRCREEGAASPFPSEADGVCWRPRELEPTRTDPCPDVESNLQIQLEMRSDATLPPRGVVEIDCRLDAPQQVPCELADGVPHTAGRG